MPNRISKYRVFAQLWNGHVRSDIGKSERVEGQESLHTAGGPTGYWRATRVRQCIIQTKAPFTKSFSRCQYLSDLNNSKMKTRQAMHVYSGKANSVTYSDCVYLTLGIHHAMRMRHIVICGLSDSPTLSHIISKVARFSGEKSNWPWNVFWLSLYFLKYLSFREKWARYDQILILAFM